MLDKKRNEEQQREDDAANPPSDRRPEEALRRVRKKLEKERARGRQNGAGKKESRAQNQGNAG